MNNLKQKKETLQRTCARHYAFAFLYRYNLSPFQSDRPNSELDLMSAISEFETSYNDHSQEYLLHDISAKKFAHTLIKKTYHNQSDLEIYLQAQLKKWKLENLTKTDLTILLLATHEMKNELETPKKVIINEYVELAKHYGIEESHSFVNGTLDQIAKDLRPNEK